MYIYITPKIDPPFPHHVPAIMPFLALPAMWTVTHQLEIGGLEAVDLLHLKELGARSKMLSSLDWFKGKSTGNHGFYHQI